MDITVGSTLTWAWPLILTALAMGLTSLINQPGWSPTLKKIVIGAASGFVGLVYAIASGLIAEVPASWAAILARWIVVAAIVLVCSQAVYRYFKNPLTTLEQVTALPAASAPTDVDPTTSADPATPASGVPPDTAADDSTDETVDEGTAGIPDE